MNDKRPSRRSIRRLLALGIAGLVTVSGLTALGLPASAHDGVDHGSEPGAESALDWTNYEKVLLTKNVGEPLDLAVLPDQTVLHTARNGEIRHTDPKTGTTRVVTTIPVYQNSEDGLQSVGIDPDFANNQWVYLVYAPPGNTPTGAAPNMLPEGADDSYWDQWKGVNRLSRFKWTGSGLDLSTEQKIIEVETQRGQCCHVGADFDWDADGNLYLSTGDNTPASAPGAAGFAPNNDAPRMNPGFDSRRGAGNTNDLRGKILRIAVQEDGTYTIPEGNLFPVGTEKTRPEIFVMGVRNPFKIDVDAETNTLSWGDYGPDATKAAAADGIRGPMGLVEWNATGLDQPHNSGWPYVHGPNAAYNEWNFETATPRGFFDPENLKNNSRWNTGLVDIPDAKPATVYYGDNPGDQPFDELVNFGTGSGQGPMGGPVYHFDEANTSTSKFPAYWNEKTFFGEFSQDYIAAFTLDEDRAVTHIEDFLPNTALSQAAQPIHDNPMDMEFGPDGSMYVLEYGDGFFRANPDAGLYRIDYAEGNKAPQARFTATPLSASQTPLEVTFDAKASTDPEGDALTYDWDFDGDGTFDATGVTAKKTYTELGQFTARLRVTDAKGKFSLTSRVISVGNQAPEIQIQTPGNGSFFSWGDAIPYSVTGKDAEDGDQIVSSRVNWTYGLGHDEHAHPEVTGTGAKGAFPTSKDSPEHGPGALLYGTVVVTYTDAGFNGLPPAAAEATLRLNPKTQEAEHAAREGVLPYADTTASGGNAVSGLGAGSFLRWDPVNLANLTGVVVRATGEGTVDLRWNAADAAPFATATIPAGAGWKDVLVPFANAPQGTGSLYVTSPNGLSLDSLTFQGVGAGDKTAPIVAATLDPAAPTGVGGVYNKPVTLGLTAADNGAISTVQYSADNGTTWTTVRATNGAYTVPFTTNGARTIQYRATDTGGNVSTVGTVSFTIDLAAANAPTVASTTTLALSAPRVTFGAPGEATVTVTGEGGTPSGEVVLFEGGTELGRTALKEGKATFALPQTLGAGTHTLRVAYGADGTYKASEGTARLIVSKAASVLTATVAPNPVKPGASAQVTIGAETATGVAGTGQVSVMVKRNLSTVAMLTGTLDESGNVVVTLPKLAAGSYKLTVTHSATANTTAASTLLNLTVQQ
ncbi:PQQ-dependent sugar dehydrogenase [Rathayibacter iranicus]|uniref:Glucose/arabinose dehydrogenase n=1 Tax=Rathayibacter iranicus NCPPB 2253 = VKM Ac-1602 TaxID=1328868 RepID=A0ABX5LB15_9MICO|nr:PQQ-dependent sugar dehydrogenase [Rathayibacter iranicus]MWV31754.1 PKD domain-containing protein [Rathayibacter iranicus NCPPB 2253 = VKM Ac-1602]PPI44945.1 glycosyl hydrolase [Rathayibacter iranicus]PPI59243.1 glycosyl hydrolase [Rathayibacter iranicus]PPI70396.1 glycosyl hydrolase [Rathayibacter iranicus]PWJ62988.1 glucose/arabinose dehydrogenase [Rathayibacter iranicus NCPPB 2253 = VKM Ac-1602]